MAEQRPPQAPSYQNPQSPGYQNQNPQPPGNQNPLPPGYQNPQPPGYQNPQPPGYPSPQPPAYPSPQPPGYQNPQPPGYPSPQPPGYQHPNPPIGPYDEPPPPEHTYPPCPEPKACPSPPVEPCPPPEPDPCEEPDYPSDSPQPPTGETGEPYAASPSGPITPAQQLEKLRNSLDAGQRELQKFEPLKISLEDLKQRIGTLEKTIESQGTDAAAYTEFYRSVETYRSALECTIPTIRCQLELTERQKACIRKAIAAVDARVKKAESDRDAQNAEVQWRKKKQKKLEDRLAWAKKWHDFFKTDLVKQITDQREKLKALQGLADPSKDQCEVWFYLNEMDSMLRSARTTEEGEACYMADLNVATFLDCWSPKCYAAAYEHWIVAFNDADSAKKLCDSELVEAEKRATALETLAKEAKEKRREWILKELKTLDCCGPKCP
jgi:hypothetical protein